MNKAQINLAKILETPTCIFWHNNCYININIYRGGIYEG